MQDEKERPQQDQSEDSHQPEEESHIDPILVWHLPSGKGALERPSEDRPTHDLCVIGGRTKQEERVSE